MTSAAVGPTVAFGPELTAVHARMKAAIDRAGPAEGLYRWMAYHLGWADEDGRPAEQRSAKGVRPALCLAACRAVGGDVARATAAAAAIELTHEFSLIHDDIQDRDRTRRGRPAVWTSIGEAHAINLGDAVFSLARIELSTSPVPDATLLRLLRRYDAACLSLAEGQYLDLLFEERDDVTADEYLAMIRRKTGALLGAAAAIGAEAGGAPVNVGDAFVRFGVEVGVAFQVADDVLGIWGDPALTGKPAGNDLTRGKESYPVLLARRSEAGLSRDLAALGSSSDRERGARQLAARMEATGIKAATEAEAKRAARAAVDSLSQLDLAIDERRALEALALGAAERVR